jgi:hypothetical protein
MPITSMPTPDKRRPWPRHTYRRTKAGTDRIVKTLEDKLREFPGERDLANGEAWL